MWVELHWRDLSRPDLLSSTSNARREPVVWIWHPAIATGPEASYIPQLEALEAALPPDDVAKVRSVQPHGIANAVPSRAPALFLFLQRRLVSQKTPSVQFGLKRHAFT
jgi:hypothetical protein